MDETIGFGDEGLDLALTLHNHRERRRLHASERDDAADPRTPANRGRPRRVHPDEPIGFTSRARRRFERVHLVARTELLESLADRLLRHRGDPQPIDGLRPADARRFPEDGLVEIREDQLAFATGIAGVNHAIDVVALEERLDELELLLRFCVARDELEAVRRHDR